MISTIRFESSRIFTKSTVIVFTLLLIASLYFTNLGISEYNYLSEEEKAFSAGEIDKTNIYMTFEQYGTAGIRVILHPSALSVFFNRSDFVKDIEAIIDTSEVVKVHSKRKGRKAFSPAERFGDLNQVIAIFGTLIIAMMGFHAVKNRHTLDFLGGTGWFKTVFSWLLVMDVIFPLILIINYGFAVLRGVSFTGPEIRVFFNYILMTLPVLNFFFLLGLVMKVSFNARKNALPFLFIAWFCVVFVLPEAGKLLMVHDVNKLPPVEILDLQKIKVLLEAEKEGREYLKNSLEQNPGLDEKELKETAKKLFSDYLKTGYLKNRDKEAAFLLQVKQIADSAAKRSLFSPVDFLNLVSADASGKGSSAYLGFLDYTLILRDSFIRFYGENRYGAGKERQVVPFIKNTENIYPSPARLPQTTTMGMGILIFYIVALAIVLFYVSRRKKAIAPAPAIPGNVRRNCMLFLLVNKEKQETLFRSLAREHPHTLDTTSHGVLNGEVTAHRFIDFACHVKGVKKEVVNAYLERLKFQAVTRLKLAHYPDEEKKKLICAVVFATEKEDVFVLNDFLKGVSNDFERLFLDMAAEEAAAGRRLIYVSSRMYAPTSSFIKQEVIVKSYQPFQLEPQKISLR